MVGSEWLDNLLLAIPVVSIMSLFYPDKLYFCFEVEILEKNIRRLRYLLIWSAVLAACYLVARYVLSLLLHLSLPLFWQLL